MILYSNKRDYSVGIGVLLVLFALGTLLHRYQKRPRLSPVTLCRRHMSQLSPASFLFANDHNDAFCESFGQLNPYLKENHAKPFSCPVTGAGYRLLPGYAFSLQHTVLAYCPSEHPWDRWFIHDKGDIVFDVIFVSSTTDPVQIRLTRMSSVRFFQNRTSITAINSCHNELRETA